MSAQDGVLGALRELAYFEMLSFPETVQLAFAALPVPGSPQVFVVLDDVFSDEGAADRVPEG